MKALYIDCCIRGEESRSARLAQAFLENLSPEYEVTRRCLMEEALYPLTAETLRQRDALLAQGKTDHPRFRFAHEIAAADLVVMAAPFWDLSYPAALRTYIEYISAVGLTYHYTDAGCCGDCQTGQVLPVPEHQQFVVQHVGQQLAPDGLLTAAADEGDGVCTAGGGVQLVEALAEGEGHPFQSGPGQVGGGSLRGESQIGPPDVRV